MTEARAPVDTAWLGHGAALELACKECPAAYGDAVGHLGEIEPSLRVRAERAFDWIGEAGSPSSFAAHLLEHHAKIQKAKPPNGKRAWFDTFGDGRVAIRPAYTEPDFVAQPGIYVHAYRTRPVWSFAGDLGRVAAEAGVA